MDVIRLPLSESAPCQNYDAAVFATLYHMVGRRQMDRTQRQLPGVHRVRGKDQQQVSRTIRQAVLKSGLITGDLGMAVLYQLCKHQGVLQVERIGVYPVEHEGAERWPVRPVQAPKVDDNDIAQFDHVNTAMGTIAAAVYPTLSQERIVFPVTEVLQIPRLMGAVALRGTETILAAQQLYN